MPDGRSDSMFGGVGGMLDDLEQLYKDVHRHPELSMNEERTAAIAAERLRSAGFEVTTGVGKTGVVGLLTNGDGPTVMLRADMDALPVQEQTGLDYASTADGIMHACGHDMHVAWLAGATAVLSAARDAWHGTLMAVFQPAEETAAGAQAMIDDGLFARFPKPDVVLGQHVMPTPTGVVGTRSGVITSAADSFEIDMFGRGARLDAEAQASGAPKPTEITSLDRYQLVRNNADAAAKVRAAFVSHSVQTAWLTYRRSRPARISAHSAVSGPNPHFAPVLHPTLETGVETLLSAAYAWLGAG
jgi:amidohydrolase